MASAAVLRPFALTLPPSSNVYSQEMEIDEVKIIKEVDRLDALHQQTSFEAIFDEIIAFEERDDADDDSETSPITPTDLFEGCDAYPFAQEPEPMEWEATSSAGSVYSDASSATIEDSLFGGPLSPLTEYASDEVAQAYVSFGGTTFSAEDAFHLRSLVREARNFTNPSICKLWMYVLSDSFQRITSADADFFGLLLTSPNDEIKDPFQHLKDLATEEYTCGNLDAGNWFVALHKLFSCCPTAEAMNQLLRKIIGSPSVSDLTLTTDLASLPIVDVQELISQLQEEQTESQASTSLASPLTEKPSLDFFPAEYQYADKTAFEKLVFTNSLGLAEPTLEDEAFGIAAWIHLAAFTFLPTNWANTLAAATPQSRVFREAKLRLHATMTAVSQDLTDHAGFVTPKVHLDTLYASWFPETLEMLLSPTHPRHSFTW